MLGEWHGMTGSVMPVRHDVHRTCRATFGADKALADLRPGAILRKTIQPDVDQTIMMPRSATSRKLSIPCGSEQRRATARRG
jgi:hypothetical protein